MKERKKQQNSWSFPKKLFAVFLFLLLIIYIQFAYLSLFPTIYGINMKEFAAARNTYATTLYAKRGTIYDIEGNTLALNVASYTVIAYLSEKRTGSNPTPLHVVDVDMTAAKLAPLLDMSEETLKNLLTKKAYQVELGPGGRGITEIKKEEIQALNLPGISFIENFKRYYPNGDFASYAIGYAKQYEEIKEQDGVKTSTFNIIGELGIEAKFNDKLTGQNGYLSYQRDRYGYKIPDTKEGRWDAINGNDIHLTLNANVQRFIETAIKDTAKTYNPEWMTITVMDAKTGAILGTSSSPSFDPNVRNITSYENPLVTTIYEPGSTMKIYTYLCAIESGKYNGNDMFMSGSVKIGSDIIRDWNLTGWGKINFDKGFEFSSNVGASYLVQNVIDKTELRNCLQKYGFGNETGLELPREGKGSLKFNYPIEVATASFGQGITTTAIQQLQALTILSNNGKMLKPYIIDKIVDSNTNKVVYQSKKQESEQVVKQSTVDYVKNLMYQVINGNDIGTTGGAYKINDFDIIGKTGTAQIYDMDHKKYLNGTNDYIFSFAGMFPKDEPEIIVYAAMRKPKHSTSYGLSQAVKGVISNVSKYLGIYDDPVNSSSMIKYDLDSYISKSVENVKSLLENKKVVPVILGNGTKVIAQYPSKGTTILSNDKVFLITNGEDIEIPNLIGWSKKDAMKLLDILGINYNTEGYGYVVSQSIPAGSIVNKELEMNLVLSNKYQVE